MPSIGFAPDEVEQTISFTSNLSFDPPQIQGFEFIEKRNAKPMPKALANPERPCNRKFFQTSSMTSSPNNCSFLSSSAENLVNEMNKLHDLNEEDELHYDSFKESSAAELNTAIGEILEKREKEGNKLNIARKSVRSKLASIFCQNETTDIDTDRKIDTVRCSGDTVEGPGSSYYVDSISFPRQDRGKDKNRNKVKAVRFKDV